MPIWTQSQQQAINSINNSVVVSAGAGSGKTTVLANRVAKIITQSNANSDELLIVTFTKLAASEMKTRIKKELVTSYTELGNRNELKRQLRLLEKSNISTLHAFCLNVIKQYYYVADIDPGYSLLSDTEATVLKTEVIEELFEKLYTENNDIFNKLEDTFSTDNQNTNLSKHIDTIYTYSTNRIQGLDFFTEKLYEIDPALYELKETEVAKFATSYLEKKLKYILNEIEKAYEISLSNDIYDPKKKKGGKVKDNITALQMVYTEIYDNVGDIEKVLNLLSSVTLPRATSAKCDGIEDIKIYRNNAKAVYDEIKSLFPFSYSEYNEQIKSLHPIIYKLVSICKDYEQMYKEIKTKKRYMDYSDLEKNCMLILKNDAIREEISNRYKFVFVDEYQDTNEIQEYIINQIAKKDNLFIVGDVKQSIYGFRNAEPKLFIKHINDFTNNSNNGEIIRLNDNFRTDKTIIDGINYLFSKLMLPTSSGVDYRMDEQLICGKATPENKKLSKIEVHIFSDVSINEDDTDIQADDTTDTQGLEETVENKEIEVDYVIALIKKLFTQQIYDDKINGYRNIVPSDIAVIGRTMKPYIPLFMAKLNEQNISYNCSDNINIYDEIEIGLIINILKIIDNKKNDMALLGIMRSFIYNFDEDDLVSIRLLDINEYNFYSLVARYQTEGFDEVLKDKIRLMNEQLQSFKLVAQYGSLENLIRKIYTDTNIFTLTLTLPNGKVRQDNLMKLLDMAISYELSTYKSLYNFILYLETNKEKNKFVDATIVSGKESLNLLTIHKSKGLEFNIVIIIGCANEIRNLNSRADINCDKDLGLCTKYHNYLENYKCNSMLKSIANIKSSEENKIEELRMLYVAMTRAKQKLYLTANIKVDFDINKYLAIDNITDFNVLNSKNYLEWLISAVCTKSLNCDSDIIYEDTNYIFRNTTGITNTDTIQEQKQDTTIRKLTISEIDEEIYNEIHTRLSYNYPFEVDTNLPAKISVSLLKNEEMLEYGKNSISLLDITTLKTETSKILTGAQKGQLVHLFMQHCELGSISKCNNLHDEIKTQLDKMLKKQLFNESEIQHINIDIIADFFQSQIGLELLSADSVYREQSFMLKLEAETVNKLWETSTDFIMVQGIIDCFYIKDGLITLVDFKTDYIKNEEYYEELNEIYSKQLKLYEKALKQLNLGTFKSSYICYLQNRVSKKIS